MTEPVINFDDGVNDFNTKIRYRISFVLIIWSILTIAIHYAIKIATFEIVLLLTASWMILNVATVVSLLVIIAEVYLEYERVLFSS